MKNMFQVLKSLAFPLFCSHCQKPTTHSWPILCEACFSSLELIDIRFRCPFCFSDGISGLEKRKKICKCCSQKELSTDYIASAFEYEGPAKSLVRELKFKDRPYLAKSLASFLLLQLEKLNWPLPDLITFVPQSFSKWLDRGYNQSELLAIELAKLIHSDVCSTLKKNSGLIPQAQLVLKDRKALGSSAFTFNRKLKSKNTIEDKVILLIDDVYTTGTTIERAAYALREGYPQRIYALTLCYTEHD